MSIYHQEMQVTITELKNDCLNLIRTLERKAKPIEVTRHGKVVAKIFPVSDAPPVKKPWEVLRGKGRLLAQAGESILKETDFEALR